MFSLVPGHETILAHVMHMAWVLAIHVYASAIRNKGVEPNQVLVVLSS